MNKYNQDFKNKALKLRDDLILHGNVIIGKTELKNINELCDYFNIAKSTLYEWVKEKARYEEFLKEELNKVQGKKKKKEVKEETFDKEIEEIFDNEILREGKLEINSEIRFLGFIASVLKIENYWKLKINQLKFAIGLKLMKESGIMEKKVRK